MNIGIIGYGRMGQAIQAAAEKAGHNVVSIIDPAGHGEVYREISAESVKDVDVLIDFSIPKAVLTNVRRSSELGIPMVLGTTGWYDKMDEVRNIVETTRNRMIWSGNFSTGVQMFFSIVKRAAEIVNRFDDYDISLHESHHIRKKDSPSGTALMLGDIILDNIKRKENIITDDFNREMNPSELGISSSRCGAIPGIHTITIDSDVDTIELTHSARSSGGFAKGAVAAAQWIITRKGFFGIEDMMLSILKGEE